jgi:hypothetical protein
VLIGECIVRLRMTDPADTAATLLAAWHGFGTAQAAGTLLALDNPDDAVLTRNARPVLHAVVQQLHAAPSLPYTDPDIETIEGLVPEGSLPPRTAPATTRTPNRTTPRPAPYAAASSRSHSS